MHDLAIFFFISEWKNLTFISRWFQFRLTKFSPNWIYILNFSIPFENLYFTLTQFFKINSSNLIFPHDYKELKLLKPKCIHK